MLRRAALLPLLMLATAAGQAPTPSEPGTAEGRCRPDETGPSVLVTVEGLKDRAGILRLEVYPPDQQDFLAGDSDLIAAGKTFRRVVESPPASGPVKLCIRVPGPGTYTMALIHDRDGKRSFSIWHDGVGFPGNPAIPHGKPPAEKARISVGNGQTQTVIIMNYMRGFFTFGPIGGK